MPSILKILSKFIYAILIVAFIIWMISGFIFLWKNPKCNSMGVFREFKHVIMLEKMDKYQ